MSATEWIAQRRELLDAATEEPWYATDGINWEARVTAGCYELADVGKTSDAELIADARASLPRALDALEAVLEVVRPHRRKPATDGSVDEHDYVGELADEIERAIETALEGKS